MLKVLELPDDRIPDLLALAHEVRERWCGPEVEVEGIVVAQDRRLPGGLPLLLAVRPVPVARALGVARHPRPGPAARQTRDTGATEFCIVAAVRGPDKRLLSQVRDGIKAIRDGRQRHPDRLLARHAHAGAGRRARRDGRAPLQPQPRDRPLALPERRHHALLGGALGHAEDDPRRPAWRSAAAASSAWGRRWRSARSSPCSSRELEPDEVPLNFLIPNPGTPYENYPVVEGADALRTVGAFRLALPRTILRFAGGRELTFGDLGAKQGMLGGINAIIVGNYLTNLGRPAAAGPRHARRAVDADQGAEPDSVMMTTEYCSFCGKAAGEVDHAFCRQAAVDDRPAAVLLGVRAPDGRPGDPGRLDGALQPSRRDHFMPLTATVVTSREWTRKQRRCASNPCRSRRTSTTTIRATAEGRGEAGPAAGSGGAADDVRVRRCPPRTCGRGSPRRSSRSFRRRTTSPTRSVSRATTGSTR